MALADIPATLKVSYFGDGDIIHERVFLDQTFIETDDLKNAQAFVVHDKNLSPDQSELIRKKVEAGEAGLLIILGPEISSESLSALLGKAVKVRDYELEVKVDDDSNNLDRGEVVNYFGPKSHPLAKEVAWQSATQVYERSIVSFDSDDHSLLVGVVEDTVREKAEISLDDAILIEQQLGKGKVYILTSWVKRGNDAKRLETFGNVLTIKNKDAYNFAFYNWSYFNWTLNFFLRESAGQEYIAFADWAHSPLPNARQLTILTAAILFTLFVSLLVYYFVRKHSLAHPEILDRIRISDFTSQRKGFSEIVKKAKADKATKPSVIRKYLARLVSGYLKEMDNTSEGWDQIGFARPLNGFHIIGCFIYISLIPAIIITAFSFHYVIPYPQSIGMTTWVAGVFSIAFTFFDLGTGLAMVKYFSEYRISDPKRAMKYVQFYVWFQLISGIVQIALIALLTAYMVPKTAYAFLTWIIIFKAISQFPGFSPVFGNIFRALQRFDLMLLLWILPAPISGIFTLIAMIALRHWGLSSPEYGEVMGIALGDVVPIGVASWVYILASIYVYRKVGYSVKVTLSAHFDWQIVKETLFFGFKFTPGAMAPLISALALPLLLSLWLNNYIELNSLLGIALFSVLVYKGPIFLLFSNLLPSISESYSHGRKYLTSYYIDQGLKWSLFFMAGVVPYFLVLAEDVFQAIVPEQWSRAVDYLWIGLLYGVIECLGKLPDDTLKGSGRPGLYTIITTIDHVSRVLFMFYFIPRYGLHGALYSYIFGGLIKAVLSWASVFLFVLKPVISWWQSVVVPLIIAFIVMLLAKITITIYPVHSTVDVTVLVVFFIFLFPSSFFMMGFFGGMDKNTLREFQASLQLNIFTRIVGQLFFYPSYWGYKISPLKERYPLRNWDKAMEEANSLMAIREKL